MRGLGLGLGFNTGPGFIPYNPLYEIELNYIIDAAQKAGYSLPTNACLDLQNTLILALKAGGIWSRTDFMGVLASTAATQDYALINWKNPYGTKMLAANAPTYTVKSGFQGDAVAADINTFFKPSNGVNYVLDDACCYVWVYSAFVTGNGIRGTNTNAHERTLNSNNVGHKVNSTNNLALAVDLSGTGLKGVNRTSSTTMELFSNTTQTSGTSTSTSRSTLDQYLLRSNLVFSDAGLSMVLYASNLVSQNTALYNAFNNYMTNLALLP